MQKNTANKWIVFAFQDEGGTNPGEPVTGDAANITANVRIDGGAANAVDDTNPTELEDGYYIFDITAAECNGDLIMIAPASSTANVNVIGIPGAVYTTPANFNDISVTATTGRLDVASIEGSDATDQINAACDTAISDAALATAANLATVDTNVDAILVDTGTTLPATLTTIEGKIDTVDTVVDGIQTDLDNGTDGLGAIKTAVDAVPTAAQNADQVWDEATADHNGAGSFGKALRQVKEGLVSVESTVNDVSASTTVFITDLTEVTSSHYSDLTLMFIDGALQGQAKPIQSYNGTTKTVTLDEALTEAPANGDSFIILSTHVHPTTQIADAVLDEALSGHTTSGSFGEAINDMYKGIILGTAQTGTLSTTQMTTDLTGYADDELIGRVVVFTGGTADGQATDITDYSSTNGLITFSAITTAPVNTDPFKIV